MKKIVIFITTLLFSISSLFFHVNAAYELPQLDTNVYSYMDYSCITNRNSDQWRLQQDTHVKTSKSGLRIYYDESGEAYFLVALAPYYGTEIGNTYKVKLDNGSEFNIMLGDCKNPNHITSDFGHECYNFITKKNCINVIEFIVDTSYLPEKVINWGSLSALNFFNANIESIEYLDKISIE